MADPEKAKPSGRPESPTTARELEFDDEPLDNPQSTPSLGHIPEPLQFVGDGGIPPPKPPRPLTPAQQAEITLKDAFPSIDAAVVKAVLQASGGNIEPAFNALLGMSDPDSQKEPTPPPKPPRPYQAPIGPTSTAQSQLLADEQYARQLAHHYRGSDAYRGSPVPGSRGRQDSNDVRARRDTGTRPSEHNEDREHSFIDDDLPIIRDNIKKGFLETQSKVSSWVTSLRKKIDGDDDDYDDGGDLQARPNPGYDPRPSRLQSGSRRSGELGRRSVDRDRYDADPEVLGDDFTNLQLHDLDDPPRRPNRPLANPDLFKPTPARSQSRGERRVSFQNGPPEEIEVGYRASPDSTKQVPSLGGKASKWQPLSTADPDPVTDHDPFSLGDSDDEESKKKDARGDDSVKLKPAAAESVAIDNSSSGKGDIEHQEETGTLVTRDKEVETLTGGKT